MECKTRNARHQQTWRGRRESESRWQAALALVAKGELSRAEPMLTSLDIAMGEVLSFLVLGEGGTCCLVVVCTPLHQWSSLGMRTQSKAPEVDMTQPSAPQPKPSVVHTHTSAQVNRHPLAVDTCGRWGRTHCLAPTLLETNPVCKLWCQVLVGPEKALAAKPGDKKILLKGCDGLRKALSLKAAGQASPGGHGVRKALAPYHGEEVAADSKAYPGDILPGPPTGLDWI